MKITAVTYGTEPISGGVIEVILWGHIPTNKEVDDKYHSLYPEIYKEVGFVNWKRDLNPPEYIP